MVSQPIYTIKIVNLRQRKSNKARPELARRNSDSGNDYISLIKRDDGQIPEHLDSWGYRYDDGGDDDNNNVIIIIIIIIKKGE